MSPVALFSTVAVAHLLAVASPGPDFAVVLRQTLANGRRAGVLTATGIGAGIVFHVSWALFGLGWVVQRAPLLLELLRYAGGLFLLWIGYRGLRAAMAPGVSAGAGAGVAATAQRSRRQDRADFALGLWTNLLNPKAMLFFAALCSAVITTDTPVALRIGVGAWMALSTFVWFSLISISVGHPALRQQVARYQRPLDAAFGLVLLFLGAVMLLAPN